MERSTTLGPTIRAALPAGIGLGCWLDTLLLYSNNITPFQRFDGTSSFVGGFAQQALGIGAAVALIFALLAFRRHYLPKHVISIGGGIFFVVGAIGFCVMALRGISDDLRWLTWILAGIIALGGIASGLVWGRVFKGLTARFSLAAVALAAITSAILATLAIVTPITVCVIIFILEACAAVVIPSIIGQCDPGYELSFISEGVRRRSLTERFRSFINVVAPALIGLLAFAFVIGIMRRDVVDTHSIHSVVLLVCGIVLGIVALLGPHLSLTNVIYRSIIPILAVLVLAENCITLVLQVNSEFDIVMIFLLYLFAALITLSSLSAIAHANEFSCDVIFSIAFMLFCLAAFAGVRVSSIINAEEVSIITTIITTVYALVMVLIGELRTAHHTVHDKDNELLLGSDAIFAFEKGKITPYAVDERCAALAREYHLTTREEEILVYLAEGHDSGYISEALYISPNTVRTHIHNIYLKLGVNTREEILARIRI